MNKLADQQKKTSKKDQEKNQQIKPDPETLDTTDPQEHMEGPISSIVQSVKEEVDKNDSTVTKDDKNND